MLAGDGGGRRGVGTSSGGLADTARGARAGVGTAFLWSAPAGVRAAKGRPGRPFHGPLFGRNRLGWAALGHAFGRDSAEEKPDRTQFPRNACTRDRTSAHPHVRARTHTHAARRGAAARCWSCSVASWPTTGLPDPAAGRRGRASHVLVLHRAGRRSKGLAGAGATGTRSGQDRPRPALRAQATASSRALRQRQRLRPAHTCDSAPT